MVEKNPLQELYPGKIINIHAYKYNGFLYRQWSNARVISNSLTHVVVNLKGSVVKKYGTKSWRFSDSTIFVFPKNTMHNAIITFKPGQNFSYHYYINLASDFIFEDDTIKFVDFDLDIKIYSKKSFDIVDRDEFLENKEIMNYPAKLDSLLSNEISKIFLLFLQQKSFFNQEYLSFFIGRCRLQKCSAH
ncbi:Protein of uncharacterised function (DUF402) [Mesomycoplasma dispar]|uniref:DUF402 domain-containing protein n=1 Tax=Mesomycoplasma dispar TaxID=86660 RepID=A0AAJ5TCL0_9BACT|nr:DUF402 domain-containing protein [Mesomycoplasma dispar]AJR12217.1 rnase g and e associated domain containing protein [Mesomycoplasma dispar]ATP59697.1 DUF402 domain-containing protein [Mesomycoplasma dispar]VEU61822.1 Protein of uncharacterised function (DUF402) [Mesomycoplasma dispar]